MRKELIINLSILFIFISLIIIFMNFNKKINYYKFLLNESGEKIDEISNENNNLRNNLFYNYRINTKINIEGLNKPASNSVILRYFYNKCDMCIEIFIEIIENSDLKEKPLAIIIDKAPNNILEKELKDLNISIIVMQEIVTDSFVPESPYFFLISSKEISHLYSPDWQNPFFIKEYLHNLLEKNGAP